MKICFRFMLGFLETDDGLWAILRRFGSGFIATRVPVLGGDPATTIFPSPTIVKPKGDWGVYALPEPRLIKFLAPNP